MEIREGSVRDYTLGRSLAVRAILRMLRTVADGKYYVRRGGVDWAKHSWPKPYVAALRVPENYPPQDALRRSTIQVNVAAQMDETDGEEINDEQLEIMESDILTAIAAAGQYKDERTGENVLVSAEFEGSTEWYDTTLRVQGYQIIFTIVY